MISTAAGVGQYHLINKKCDEIFEEVNDDINELKQSDEVLENQDDKVFNDNLEELKMNAEISEKVEDEIRSAYSLNENHYSKGGDFIVV